MYARGGATGRHTWFIGDIHGCLGALHRLEERCRRFSERRDVQAFFVSLGDLVDRGPDSAGVVRHFREGAAAGTHAAIPGNHEEMMLRCLAHAAPENFDHCELPDWVAIGEQARGKSPRGQWLTGSEHDLLGRLMWLAQGGSPTMASWGADPHDISTWRMPREDIDFLCGLPLVYEGGGAVATHALVTHEDLEALRLPNQELTPDRAELYQRVLWSRRLPDTAPDRGTHVSGHTPLRRVRRYRGRRLVRVDTGCYLGWRLSAWCSETDDVVSVASDGRVT